MSALVSLVFDRLLVGADERLAAPPTLAAELTAAVTALDAATLPGELSELQVLCDMLLGRGQTAAAEVIIDAVADALAARPRTAPSAKDEQRSRAATGAAASGSLATAAPAARGRAWLAIQSQGARGS